jgi:hypothetical protein
MNRSESLKKKERAGCSENECVVPRTEIGTECQLASATNGEGELIEEHEGLAQETVDTHARCCLCCSVVASLAGRIHWVGALEPNFCAKSSSRRAAVGMKIIEQGRALRGYEPTT